MMMFKKSLLIIFIAFVFSSIASTGVVSKVFIAPFKTANSFIVSTEKNECRNYQSVVLGKSLLTSRLVNKDGVLVCLSDIKNADYELESVLTNLRSKENHYISETYGVETRNTNWQLDLIVQIKRISDGVIVFSKTVTSLCTEQRPISEAKIDNDLFHSLMVSAIEEAGELVVEYFVQRSPSCSLSVPSHRGIISASKAERKNVSGKFEGKELETLAIMKPRKGDGITDLEVMMLWDFLEGKLGGGTFIVVSRSDISRMMDEMGLTTNSYLSDPLSRKRARVGKLGTVSRLLAPSVGRFGNRYLLTLKIFDSSTAEIDGSRTKSVSADTLEGLLPLAEEAMQRLLAPTPKGIVLAPVEIQSIQGCDWLAASMFNQIKLALVEAGFHIKTGKDANGEKKIIPAVTTYSIRLEEEKGVFVHKGDIGVQLSIDGAAPLEVRLADVNLGKVEGAVPAWLARERGEKLLALAIEKLSPKLQMLKIK